MLMATEHTWLTTLGSRHAGPRSPQSFQASKSPKGAPVVQNEPTDSVSSYITFTEGKEQHSLSAGYLKCTGSILHI